MKFEQLIEKIFWTTRDGRKLNLTQMSVEHINACINMLKYQLSALEFPEDMSMWMLEDTAPQYDKLFNWIVIFKMELSRRDNCKVQNLE